MVDICDIGEKIDLDGEDEEEKEKEIDKDLTENKHPYGSPEWEKVEEENLRKKSEKRIDAMKEKHKMMDKVWEKNYTEAQDHIQHLLPIQKENKKGKFWKEKAQCPMPQLGKEKPLEKICEVLNYKACVIKGTAEMHDPDHKPKE